MVSDRAPIFIRPVFEPGVQRYQLAPEPPPEERPPPKPELPELLEPELELEELRVLRGMV